MLIASIVFNVLLYIENIDLKDKVPAGEFNIEEISYFDESPNEESLIVNNIPVKVKANGNITVNNKIVTSIIGLPQIYVFDNDIIFVSKGNDIRNTHVYIVNSDGDLVKEIYNLDSKYDDMVIDDSYSSGIVLSNDGIEFIGTRINKGPVIESISKKSKKKTDVNLESCSVYNKYSDVNVYGTYKLKYLGDGKWGKIKNTGYTALKDSEIKCNN